MKSPFLLLYVPAATGKARGNCSSRQTFAISVAKPHKTNKNQYEIHLPFKRILPDRAFFSGSFALLNFLKQDPPLGGSFIFYLRQGKVRDDGSCHQTHSYIFLLILHLPPLLLVSGCVPAADLGLPGSVQTMAGFLDGRLSEICFPCGECSL